MDYKRILAVRNVSRDAVLVYEDRNGHSGSYVNSGRLYNKGLDAPSYAYEFSPQSKIVRFFVADNRRTQDDIYGLMADVMYEAWGSIFRITVFFY